MRRGTLISRRSSIGRRGGGDLEGIWWEKDWPLFNDTELLAGEKNIDIIQGFQPFDSVDDWDLDNKNSTFQKSGHAMDAFYDRVNNFTAKYGSNSPPSEDLSSTDWETRSYYLHTPRALAYHDKLGLIISDTINNRLLRIPPGGNLEKYAGYNSEKSGPHKPYSQPFRYEGDKTTTSDYSKWERLMSDEKFEKLE
ncbi:hypothetical protein AAMO2058_000593900 [Amorphochlora amoebiformis]